MSERTLIWQVYDGLSKIAMDRFLFYRQPSLGGLFSFALNFSRYNWDLRIKMLKVHCSISRKEYQFTLILSKANCPNVLVSIDLASVLISLYIFWRWCIQKYRNNYAKNWFAFLLPKILTLIGWINQTVRY